MVHCMYILYFLYPFIHFCTFMLFQIFTIMNSVKINMKMQIYLYNSDFNVFVYKLKSVIAASYDSFIYFIFLGRD